MEKSEKNILKTKVVSGLVWTYAERFLAQGVSLVVSIVLARLVAPEHYGAVSIVTICIGILNVFVTSGLGSSLIQKKDSDELDFSTAFYAGLCISALLYGVLFIGAPIMASFFKLPELTALVRALGIQLPLSAINTVQHAFVSKKLIFKKFFFSTLFGTLVSAVVGIALAYCNYGPWALVFQHLTNTLIDTLVLLVILPWKPRRMFSFTRFRQLFQYGWKILLSDLIQSIYDNVRSMAVGKKYSSADLAYYNRGQQFTSLIVTNIDASLIKVLFPAISAAQDDRQAVKNMTRRSIKVSSYLMSPLLLGLVVTARPLVLLLLTENWLACVPYLQILCVANLFQPMHSANLQSIKAIGRSDVALRLEIIKKTYSIIILILSIALFNDPFAVAVGFVLSTFLSVIVNSFPNKKLLHYGYLEQLKDIFPHLLLSGIMGALVYAVGMLSLPLFMGLVLQVITGFLFYVTASALFRMESFFYLLDLVKSFTHRKR